MGDKSSDFLGRRRRASSGDIADGTGRIGDYPIEPLVGNLIRDSYVQVAPNIRLARRRLRLGQPVAFDAPIAGRYALYNESGHPVAGVVEVNGKTVAGSLALTRGTSAITLRSGPEQALFVPQGSYAGLARPGADNQSLFAGVYT